MVNRSAPDAEKENRSGIDHQDAVGAGDAPQLGRTGKRKRPHYFRHTPVQIQELQAYAAPSPSPHTSDSSRRFALLASLIMLTCAHAHVLVLLLRCRLFQECSHPDEKQRAELGRKLGLRPIQVKFWFQNRRTQMKVRITDPIRLLLLALLVHVMDLLTRLLPSRGC
jgi:hypothetical protein